MTLPNHPIAVLCDIDTAWELNKELLEAGVPCLFKKENSFRTSYKNTFDVGLIWGRVRVIFPLMKINADTVVSMPEFRAAFDLPIKPQP